MTAIPKPSKKRKDSRPSRDEFELMEMAEKLEEARESSQQLDFTIWRRTEGFRGVVTKMDASTQSVHIRDRMGDLIKVPFLDILNAEKAESF